MKFGLTEDQHNYILKVVVEPLKIESHADVYCYGSRAKGSHSQFSDLDLMVESDQDLSKKISSIKEVLVKGNFPLKVDLVQKKDFAESYLPSYENDKVIFK